MRRPARVKPLRPSAIGEILNDAGALAAAQSEGITPLVGVEAVELARCRRRERQAQEAAGEGKEGEPDRQENTPAS